MLKQRVITALVLLAILLPALWAPVAWPFMLFVLLAISAAAWEWARLNGCEGARAWLLGGLVLLGFGALLQQQPALPATVWIVALASWCLGGSLALRGAAPGWSRWPQPLRLALGPLLLLPAGLALLAWKGQGLNALLSTLCLVWAADIAAYFGGRRFGRRKLAPAISPGKSWEGVWSGFVGVLLLALLWVLVIDRQAWVDGPSLFGQLVGRHGWPLAGLALALLTALSVVGDLFESLVKRAAGAKDSSQLLPGHGGVLDRIDALLPVLPAALALTTL
ncbi:phosphatidate cytidylyltransferase [Inhella proteolytica]|uniref:Phosphatidate cytidylyltransferase n=1 Tax=Inhella proteolytica TaxID=2795029 RepID=A0A931J7P8_9BURK|nr:phosphatidate cytidylyltransferase [Inhella proteolytica]MBH9577650.1 phosphatidate cytidylyltransferase [Inhella proteolytica]